MTHFRFRYAVAGGHTHVRVFAGKNRDQTLGLAGNLVFENGEFEDFKRTVSDYFGPRGNFEFVREDHSEG